MGETLEQVQIRALAFTWLDSKLLEKPWLTWSELQNDFGTEYGRMPLITQRGIWNPKQLDSTLSIQSSKDSPYTDRQISEELFEYSYQGDETSAGDNTKLRHAMDEKVPLIFFEQIKVGVYLPRYPVFVVADDPIGRHFTISLGKTVASDPSEAAGVLLDKAYAERSIKSRLHQPRFRAEVLMAYNTTCAVCRLRHVELLDAAHIIPDSMPEGVAAVSNGMSLCKIHHAAYDRNILGISPDLQVHIRPDLMLEVDGPMLKFGLQEMDGATITVPSKKQLTPNKDSLAWKFDRFKTATV
jgi:putative restriction endonuclease